MQQTLLMVGGAGVHRDWGCVGSFSGGVCAQGLGVCVGSFSDGDSGCCGHETCSRCVSHDGLKTFLRLCRGLSCTVSLRSCTLKAPRRVF
jgi:hypothetical protein